MTVEVDEGQVTIEGLLDDAQLVPVVERLCQVATADDTDETLCLVDHGKAFDSLGDHDPRGLHNGPLRRAHTAGAVISSSTVTFSPGERSVGSGSRVGPAGSGR